MVPPRAIPYAFASSLCAAACAAGVVATSSAQAGAPTSANPAHAGPASAVSALRMHRTVPPRRVITRVTGNWDEGFTVEWSKGETD